MWWIVAMVGTTVASIVTPYIWPIPAPAQTPLPDTSTQDNLLKISLILGIAISAFTLAQYFKGKI